MVRIQSKRPETTHLKQMAAVSGLETIKKYYRVDRSEISYLRFVLESYEGVGILTTLDPATGSVVLIISPGCLKEAEMIIADLQKEMIIEAA